MTPTNSNNHPLVDYMARDYDSLLQSMRALIPQRIPEWKDATSEADLGNVLLELFAHMGDIVNYYLDRVITESYLGTAQSRRSIIQHLRLIGYELGTAGPAAAKLSLSVPGSFTGKFTLKRGDAFATKSQRDAPSVRFEFNDKPLTIDFSEASTYQLDAQGRKVFDGIQVEEGRLVREEVLGTSNGTPNQRFPLARTGLILLTRGPSTRPFPEIELTTGPGEPPWMLQETLTFSRNGQRDFTIEIDENDQATIVFGDGAFGAIPPANAVIKATYRVGGGVIGNVGIDAIQTIVDVPQLASAGARVTNPKPATGGADRESISYAVQHAPAVFRSLKRAVTAQDFEALARNIRGVGKVRAQRGGWNTVNLYVAPQGGGYVSDVLEANLLNYFEDKRPVSTIVEIKDVDYVKVFVSAQLGVKPYYSRQEIASKVTDAAAAILAFDNVDFGKPIYLSSLYEAIEAVEGVEYVNINEFRRDGEKLDNAVVKSDGKLVMEPNEIPVAGYAGSIKLPMTDVEGGF